MSSFWLGDDRASFTAKSNHVSLPYSDQPYCKFHTRYPLGAKGRIRKLGVRNGTPICCLVSRLRISTVKSSIFHSTYKSKRYFSSPKCLGVSGAQPTSRSVDTGNLFRKKSGRGLMSTSDLHLSPILRTNGTYFLFLLHDIDRDSFTFCHFTFPLVFMVCCIMKYMYMYRFDLFIRRSNALRLHATCQIDYFNP